MTFVNRWSDLPLRTKGLFVVAVPAGATIILALTGYALGTRTAADEQWVRHSLLVSQEIQRLRTNEAEIGALARGYFIVADPVFTNQLRDAIAAFDTTRQQLLRLTAADAGQVWRLSRIGDLERSRVERIYGAVARFESAVLPAEELRAAVRAAEAECGRTNSLLSEMEGEEKRLLELRFEQVDRLRVARRIATLICVLIGVIGGFAISILFASGITRRIGKLQENVARLATCGVLDPLPGGRDEIGALSEGIARNAEILRRRNTALENALHGIAEADVAGRCLSYNKAYAELAGLPECCVPVSITETVHPHDQPKVEAAIEEMRGSGRAELEARIVHRQGKVTDVAMTLLPATEDRQANYYVFLHDSTLRKETEAALVMAKDAAVASSMAKTRFLAKISHDIRTPLNAILGAADLLSQTALDPKQCAYVDMFQRNCRRLVRLINDFLDFSRIEAGAVQVQKAPCRVREMVEEAAATFRESAARKGLELRFEIVPEVPEWALADSARVQQVLVNLISNAVKFTEDGGVCIRVRMQDHLIGDCIHIAVEDTGPGIDEEDQARIFAAFAQLPDKDASHRGSGLGLTICRELVELMGGEIGVSSRRGLGSTFHFTLPLEPVPDVDAPPVSPPNAICRGWCLEEPARVLIAEDTADNRTLLEHYLDGEPVELTFAVNGQEALEQSKRNEFDLILMDIDMPGLDGYQAAKLIRKWQAEQGTVPTPIVALSAHAMREAVRASLDAGCVAHVAKPVDRSTLLKTIKRYALAKSVRPECPPDICVVADGVASLIPVYLASKPQQIEDARASLERHDFDPVRRFGHNLKGTGGGYGFLRIQEIGAAIETAASEKDEESIRGQLEALYRFVTQESVAKPLAVISSNT